MATGTSALGPSSSSWCASLSLSLLPHLISQPATHNACPRHCLLDDDHTVSAAVHGLHVYARPFVQQGQVLLAVGGETRRQS